MIHFKLIFVHSITARSSFFSFFIYKDNKLADVDEYICIGKSSEKYLGKISNKTTMNSVIDSSLSTYILKRRSMYLKL